MTWIIGGSSLFGYGAMLSDVCVSFSNGTRRNILQKAYPVGQYVLAGFAGSVSIGFTLLESMRNFLHLPNNAPKNVAWRPLWIAEKWKSIAAESFALACPEEKKLGSEFIIVGVDPEDDFGHSNFPRTYVIKFVSPHYEPVIAQNGLSFAHIGSGSSIETYSEALREYFDIKSDSLQTAVVDGPGEWAASLGFFLSLLLQDVPTEGVSPNLFVHLCSRNGFITDNNDSTSYPLNGPPIEFKMPKVATSYSEFVTLCNEWAVESALAVA